MALPRFYCETLDEDRAVLTGVEARHALHVRRLGVGDLVSLFDGRGGEAAGRIVEAGRGRIEIAIERRWSRPEVAAARLTVAAAPPKGPRGDWMIEKAAELGVFALIPLLSERGVAHPGPGRIDRWRRAAQQVNKQSGRSLVMQVTEPMSVEALAERLAGYARCWLLDPTGSPWSAPYAGGPDDAVLVAVGPEGGWTPAERELLARRGAVAVCIADGVLRVETAVVAAAALFAAARVGPRGGGA